MTNIALGLWIVFGVINWLLWMSWKMPSSAAFKTLYADIVLGPIGLIISLFILIKVILRSS